MKFDIYGSDINWLLQTGFVFISLFTIVIYCVEALEYGVGVSYLDFGCIFRLCMVFYISSYIYICIYDVIV